MMKKIFKKISTPPASSSYKWGSFFSILSWLLLETFWLFRIISILQLLKLGIRKLYEWQQVYTGKQDSKRPDVPPFLQEYYFVTWLAVFLICQFSISNVQCNSWIYLLAAYFLFESSVWIIYYTMLRRFFEESYSIYHPIEYFVLLPVVMVSQALAIHFLFWPLTIDESFLVLMGLSESDVPFYIKMIGILYLAFVLSMIINGFPNEKRKSDAFYKVGIIGNGQVVKQRTLTALKNSSIRQNKIIVFTIDDDERNDKDIIKFKHFEDIIKDIKECKMVFISTPSYCHVEYLERLVALKVFVVMEKPITVIRKEINFVKSMQKASLLDNVFFLSYYKLEKALPLTYLNKPSVFYEKYLNVNKKAKLFNVYESLGIAKEVDVYLVEGKDDRKWIYETGNGGHLFETFLHNVIIAAQFADLPKDWTVTQWKSANAIAGKQGKPIILECKADSKSNVKLNLIMAKGMDVTFRGARIKFEYGEIIANFETQMLSMTRGNNVHQLHVKEEFKDKYAIQVDMAITCYENPILPEMIDGYENQLEILEWLFDQKSKIKDMDNQEAKEFEKNFADSLENIKQSFEI